MISRFRAYLFCTNALLKCYVVLVPKSFSAEIPRLNNQDYFFGGNGINIEISNNFEWAKSSEDVLTRVLKLVGDNSKLFDKVTSPDNEVCFAVNNSPTFNCFVRWYIF